MRPMNAASILMQKVGTDFKISNKSQHLMETFQKTNNIMLTFRYFDHLLQSLIEQPGKTLS